VSSLRDDMNSRAYASADRYYRDRDLEDGSCSRTKGTPACVVCKADGIPLNDAGECAGCEPREEETCEAWIERTKARRAK